MIECLSLKITKGVAVVASLAIIAIYPKTVLILTVKFVQPYQLDVTIVSIAGNFEKVCHLFILLAHLTCIVCINKQILKK